jgi:hypothetical protein
VAPRYPLLALRTGQFLGRFFPMWVNLCSPSLPEGAQVTLSKLLVAEGQRVEPGDPLLDLIIDLSGGIDRDCPPISTCRLVSLEGLWVRKIMVGPGAGLGVGETIALLATEQHSAAEPPLRPARVTQVAVLQAPDWWESED